MIDKCRPKPKIALISRDYEAADFRKSLNRILQAADDLGCNHAYFSLYSVHRTSRLLDLSWMLESRAHLERVVLETGDLWNETDLRTEVWCRDLDYPRLYKRQFAFSAEPQKTKQRFISQFQHRVIDDMAVCICGEIGIVRINRGTGRIVDDFSYRRLLTEYKVNLLVNPFHTKAFRYEINMKRKHLSQDGRWTISVWNEYRNRGRDDACPWALSDCRCFYYILP